MDTFTTSARHSSSRSGEDKREAPKVESCHSVQPCELSHSAALLGQALTAAHSAPDIREDRVAAIKARLAAGTYEIDSGRIAEALVNEHTALFATLN